VLGDIEGVVGITHGGRVLLTVPYITIFETLILGFFCGI
jgi:hypothetical protein